MKVKPQEFTIEMKGVDVIRSYLSFYVLLTLRFYTTVGQECAAVDKLCEACPTNNTFVRVDYASQVSHLESILSDVIVTEDTLLEGFYGPRMNYKQHMNWILDHVQRYMDDNAPGFRKTGEKEGIVYEIHDQMTAKLAGAGYFRLKADVNVSKELFIALLMDTKAIAKSDETVVILGTVKEFEDKQTWLMYWRNHISKSIC